MGAEPVMSPLLSAIGRRVAGLRPIRSLRKSGAAPLKPCCHQEERRGEERGTCGCGVTSAAAVWTTRVVGPRGRVHAKALVLGQRPFLIAPCRLQTGVGAEDPGVSVTRASERADAQPDGYSHPKDGFSLGPKDTGGRRTHAGSRECSSRLPQGGKRGVCPAVAPSYCRRWLVLRSG